MTAEAFIVLYPEFAAADTALVTAHLDEQTGLTKGDLTAASKEALIGLRTADALAHSPLARDLKLVDKDGKSVFSDRLQRLTNAATLVRRA